MKILDILNFLKEENVPFTFAGNETDAVEGFSSLKHYKAGFFYLDQTTGKHPGWP